MRRSGDTSERYQERSRSVRLTRLGALLRTFQRTALFPPTLASQAFSPATHAHVRGLDEVSTDIVSQNGTNELGSTDKNNQRGFAIKHNCNAIYNLGETRLRIAGNTLMHIQSKTPKASDILAERGETWFSINTPYVLSGNEAL
ncbi:hypothetical protein K0M31_017993 [Melipona bicolor]|uniref:Uncharacterized protein n=1 Tax=Melipona bicolor TaxID=60889 RepID=A0AA40KDZ1_9HYME|nr:hypothetical protein K0M31_017993 [Melipona bicolor]